MSVGNAATPGNENSRIDSLFKSSKLHFLTEAVFEGGPFVFFETRIEAAFGNYLALRWFR